MIDLDQFKLINDSYGHQTGDDALVEVARRLRETTRTGELVARIGGDEFAVILTETDAAGAYALSERVRNAIRTRPFGDSKRITISSGICDLAQAGDADQLVRLADGALYWAKANGRDRGYVYSAEVVQELSAEERAERLARSQALAGVRALARAVDARDHNTQEHSERVADLAARLADACGWSQERVARLREAALVHDVGKIGVADQILLKPGRLTPHEYEQIKVHANLGAQIAREVLDQEQTAWIRHHHERPDGGGYPDGLPADLIPEGAALLALADAWDAMTTSRAYSPAKAIDQAHSECRALAGRQFSHDAVSALQRIGIGDRTRSTVAAATGDDR
jgi:diguanylate cyclase (GGDEF)-like protein/putative nucleotidyltransferase with HDIG domain